MHFVGKKDNFLVQGRKVGNCVPIRIVRNKYTLLSAYRRLFVVQPSGDCRATVGRPSGIGLVERGAGDKYLTKTLTKTEKG